MREHEIFRSPNAIDVGATRPHPTPKSWRVTVPGAEVAVLPLADAAHARKAGWCANDADLEDSPEVEVFCGGVNSKTPGYAGLWRQGNLVHFGFEQAPSELNDTGRALLENAIVYAARFAGDRPIATTPSGFVDRDIPRSRHRLRLALDAPGTTAEALAAHFGAELRDTIRSMSAEAARDWIRANWGVLAADATGRLAPDPDAQALAIAIDEPSFFDAALHRAGAEETSRAAIALLARRIPGGPGPGATPAEWGAFLDAERDFLFFTETGGYVWLVDPLARKRGVPSRDLRGVLRADRD